MDVLNDTKIDLNVCRARSRANLWGLLIMLLRGNGLGGCQKPPEALGSKMPGELFKPLLKTQRDLPLLCSRPWAALCPEEESDDAFFSFTKKGKSLTYLTCEGAGP